MGFPGGVSGNDSTSQCKRLKRPWFNPWVGKITFFLRRRTWQSIPVFLPGESHEQRSLVGYNPQGCKESYLALMHAQKHLHEYACALSLKLPQFCCSGRHCFGKNPQCSLYLLQVINHFFSCFCLGWVYLLQENGGERKWSHPRSWVKSWMVCHVWVLIFM